MRTINCMVGRLAPINSHKLALPPIESATATSERSVASGSGVLLTSCKQRRGDRGQKVSTACRRQKRDRFGAEIDQVLHCPLWIAEPMSRQRLGHQPLIGIGIEYQLGLHSLKLVHRRRLGNHGDIDHQVVDDLAIDLERLIKLPLEICPSHRYEDRIALPDCQARRRCISGSAGSGRCAWTNITES